MSKQKELFQEDVVDTIELLRKKISKKRGNLDRHIIKQEVEIESMEEEKGFLEKLRSILPARRPELIKPETTEEK